MAKLHRDNAGYIGCSHEETQDPYYSYNKLSLPLSGATGTVQRPAEVTHTVTVAGGKFVIGGVSQATLSLTEGGVYKFDQSDSSNSSHPFKFSQTSNGTWNRGTEYTKGVSYVGTPGSSGAYTQLVVPFGGLDLYYYCGNHTGMGGSASTPANAGMFTAALPILKTTDQFGATLGSGTNPDPFAANLVLAVPMNGSNNGTTFADQSAAIRGSGSAKAITRTNAVTSTTKSKYYGSSGYYDANSSYLGVANSSDFDFGSGDYTIEIWVHPTDTGTRNIVTRAFSGGTGNYSGFILSTAGFLETTSQSSWDVNISHTLPLNTWSHCAVTRNGSLWTYLVNGVSVGTAVSHGSVPTGPGDLYVSYRTGQNDFWGYLSDLRIYKGVAKYQPEESGDLGFQALSYLGIGVKQSIGDPVYSDHITATGSGAVTGLHSTQYSARGLFDGDSNTYFASAAGNVSSNPAILTITFPPGYRPPYSNNVVLEAYAGTTDTVRVAINGGAWQTVSGSNNWAQHTVASGSGEISEIKVSRQKANTNNGAAELRKILIDGVELRDSGGAAPLLFKPDFVWLKNDDSSTGHHCLYDSVRGVYKHIQTSSSTAEYTENTGRGLSAFNSDGFTLDTSNGEHVGEGNINVNNQRYSAYAWKAGGAATTITANSIRTVQNVTAGNDFSAGWAGSTSGTWADTDSWSGLSAVSGTAKGYFSSTETLSDGSVISVANSSFGAGASGSNGWVLRASTSCTLSLTVYPNITEIAVTTSDSQTFANRTIVATNPSSGSTVEVTGKCFWFGTTSQMSVSTMGTVNNAPALPSRASSVSANNTYGFSVVTWTGQTSGTADIGHGLSSPPKFIVLKGLTGSVGWTVGHDSIGWTKRLKLNAQDPVSSASSNYWNNTAPTSSVFTSGANNVNNTFVAYCWSEVANYSKISSYTGTGTSGNVVTTGFRPSFLLIKADIDGEDWIIMDDARTPVNPVNDAFFANTGAVPNANSVYSVDFNDDGFTVNNNNPRFNTDTKTYYYMAIAGRKPTDPGPDAFKIAETLNTQDQSSSAHSVTNNGSSFQTSVKKFYDGAAAFTGGTSVTVPSSGELQFGTGDFTIEGWMHPTSYGVTYPTVISKYDNGDTSWILRLHNSGQVVWYSGTSGGTNNASSSGLSLLNQWSHIAVVRQAGVATVYLNGSQVLSVADTFNYDDTNAIYFGRQDANNVNGLEGYLQDFRLYKGIAKYTSSFSPPERSIQGTARRYPSGIYVVS